MIHSDTQIYKMWDIWPNMDFSSLIQPACISIDRMDCISYQLPNLFIHIEPAIILDHVSYLINNYTKYHTILTYDHDVIIACSNARFYTVSTCWISPEFYKNNDISKKQFKISTLAGSKLINESIGHLFRQMIHHRQEELKEYPITYFRSSVQLPHLPDYGNNPLLSSKEDLFETYQFAIVLENTRQRNSFSEKIIDCIITKTIPIYYGCCNIHQFFDTTGWIILDSADMNILQSKLSSLDSLYYEKYNDIIEKNYIKAHEYTNFYDNLNHSISREEYLSRYGDK